MEDIKLQLSSEFWTANSLTAKVGVFQKFLTVGNSVIKENHLEYIKFEVTGINISVQLIFLADFEILPKKFDSEVFKLIFLPKGSSQPAVEKVTQQTNTFAFLFE